MMMDRIREARRGSMVGVNGGLSRRRQRSSLRDSPEEDGAIEMQELGRLRDRGSKKDRDRDRSNRSKRRRGERIMHENHREEGEESSEESVDEEDDEDDDTLMSVRLPHPAVQNPAPSASVMQNHQLRRGYPAKPVRPPGSCTWKVSEEMIGAPIPRKARSSSVKRSQECWVSSGCGGDGGVEQVHGQPSTSPARPSPSSTTPVSPSSSNASVRKKMKTISGTKHRPLKTSKSSIHEIEIEVAEVLFGMTRQVPPKLENHKHDSKESNGMSNEVKSKVSSPVPISSPATSQPSTAPSNPSSTSTLLTTTAPKRKRPRMRLDEESPTSRPVSVVLPEASAGKSEVEALAAGGSKAIDASPRSENTNTASPVVDNGGVSFDPAISNNSSTLASPTKVQHDSVKQGSCSPPDSKDTDSRPEMKAKEEAVSPPKESHLDVNLEEQPASKAVVVSESPREDKFSIDLMASPGKSRAEMESTTADMKMQAPPPPPPSVKSFPEKENTSVDMKMPPKLEVSRAEGEKMEKKLNSEPKEVVMDDKNVGKLSALEFESKNRACKERNLYLQIDQEKHQNLKQETRISRAETFTDKAGATASLPMPMQITGWPGGFPPFGFMGQVPPLPSVVPVDGSTSASKTLQSFLPPQLRPKRCATHCYIAQNVLYHQQITRLNTFWPAAAGAAPLFASKQYNLNSVPPADPAILGSPLQGSLSGRSLGSMQEKVSPATTAHSNPSIKEKSNPLIDASHRKPQMLQQPSQTASAGNMLAPAFIFPLNQQQAAAAGATTANRPGVAKLTQGATGSAAQSSSGTSYAAMGPSGTSGPGSTMNFNYPSLPPNEAQYLAFLQNNAYSFPIPPPYRGANPAQTMPYINLSFYPPQMLHPSQLRMPQQPTSSQLPPTSQQPLYSQQGHQNPSTSSGSSSSQKNTQQSQRVPAAGASAIAAGSSLGFPHSKLPYLPHQVRQMVAETGGEDAPSTADSRVLQDQKSIFTQKFSMPTHSQNFTLIAPATAPLISGGGNHSEKQPQHQTQNQVMKVDLTPSQAFAMSFASFGGAAAAAGGAAPNGLDFSSMAQNHALLQSLPEAARQGYQISAAAAAAAAHTAQQQQKKKSEEGRPATELGNSSTPSVEGKVSSLSKVLGNAQQHSLTISKAEKDAPVSSMLVNNMMDSCTRTLNLIHTPSSGSARVSSRPGSAAPAPFSGIPVSQASNSLHLQSQQYQQQVLQLQKQEQQRAKPSSHSNANNVYADRLSSNSNASKLPQALAGFPPTLIQSSVPIQSPQWKATPRAATPASSATPSLTTSSSVKNQISLQQQVRSPQLPVHQTQISFGVGPAKVAGQAAQHLSEGGRNAATLSPSATAATGSSPSSVSKNLGGSPHSSSAAKSGPTPSLSLPVLPFQKTQIGKSSSSSSSAVPSSLPTTNRNMPSILGNPHINPAASSSSKPQPPSQYLPPHQLPKQQFPQPQFFFSNHHYMQAQTSQSDATTATAAYFQQHQQRRPPDQLQSQQQQNSGNPCASSSLTLASDQSKGGRVAPAGNSKGSASAGHVQHPSQLAAVSQLGSGDAHPLMSAAAAAFPYIHTMQSVPVKPPAAAAAAAEQKPAGGR